MPGRDGTGPLGRGPMKGRGLGPCGRDRRGGMRPDRATDHDRDTELRDLQERLDRLQAEIEKMRDSK